MGYVEELEAAYEELSGKYITMCLWVPMWCERKLAGKEPYLSFRNIRTEYAKICTTPNGTFMVTMGQGVTNGESEFSTIEAAKNYVEEEFRIPNE
jgi:hypothetical protein